MILNPEFKKIGTTDKRYIVVTGGRGSAKSFSITTMLCALIQNYKNHRVLFTRYTMTSANLSIIPEFIEKIDILKLNKYFKVNKREITNTATESDILFRGIKTSSGNQTAALKSIQGVTTWVLDEAEEMIDETEFDTIDLSIRSKAAKNTVILILNPTTKEHWIYKRWFEGHLQYKQIDGQKIAVSSHPDILHIHTTYLNNLEHLHESFLNAVAGIKRDNPKKYVHRILGGWLEKAEGVIFENWEEGKFNENLPFAYGLDFGYSPDPLALIKLAIDKKAKNIYAKEIIYKTGLDDVPRRLKAENIARNSLIVCDTNEPRTMQAIRKAGFNIQKTTKQTKNGVGQIAQDIREIKNWTLIIDPDSQNLKIELNNYVWNNKKASVPIDDYNHLLDALRYAFKRLNAGRSRGVRRVN